MITLLSKPQSDLAAFRQLMERPEGDYLCLLCLTELPLVNEQLRMPAEVVAAFERGGATRLENHRDYDYIMLNVPELIDTERAYWRIGIYYQAKRLVFVADDPQILARLTKFFALKVDEAQDLVVFLHDFFDRLTVNDFQALADIETDISQLEEALISAQKDNCIKEIILLRKKLLTLKRYYEFLYNILLSIEENQDGLYSSKKARGFKIISNRVDRLLRTITNLGDYVSQVREAYQAQVDINLNNIMKLFTVITAIFLPLTLLVGWYGMNVQMPEVGWPYGYPFVIALSLVIISVTAAFFKKHKWF